MRTFRALVFPSVFPFLISLILLPVVAGHATTSAPKGAQEVTTAGCTLAEGTYRCNLPAFQRAMAAAQRISIETQPMDRVTAAQLRRLVASLGKQLGTNDHPAALWIALTPVEPVGITYGPGDHDLATLRVYANDNQNRHGDLIWAETLRGQGDTPFPAQVNELIQQFQSRLSVR